MASVAPVQPFPHLPRHKCAPSWTALTFLYKKGMHKEMAHTSMHDASFIFLTSLILLGQTDVWTKNKWTKPRSSVSKLHSQGPPTLLWGQWPQDVAKGGEQLPCPACRGAEQDAGLCKAHAEQGAAALPLLMLQELWECSRQQFKPLIRYWEVFPSAVSVSNMKKWNLHENKLQYDF